MKLDDIFIGSIFLYGQHKYKKTYTHSDYTCFNLTTGSGAQIPLNTEVELISTTYVLSLEKEGMNRLNETIPTRVYTWIDKINKTYNPSNDCFVLYASYDKFVEKCVVGNLFTILSTLFGEFEIVTTSEEDLSKFNKTLPSFRVTCDTPIASN